MLWELRASARGGCARAWTRSFASKEFKTYPNWLEKNCGDVPTSPREGNMEFSEMIRCGHAAQVGTASLLDGQLSGISPSHSKEFRESVQELKYLEDSAVERIEQAVVNENVRFRPSVLIPFVQCKSQIVGRVLGLVSENIATSYLLGTKLALSEYYNDQIREIYEKNPQEKQLKEVKDNGLFKKSRDEELQFIDQHNVSDEPKRLEEDDVMRVAKTATNVLLNITRL